MENFQRTGAISNAHVGRDFENLALECFQYQGMHLLKNFKVPVGIGAKTKIHAFDLELENPRILIECKSHRWTASGNVPSAKLTVWNEAMYYFYVAPDEYRKILFVLRDFNTKKNETLAEYYIRTYSHLIPSKVELWEFDDRNQQATQLYG